MPPPSRDARLGNVSSFKREREQWGGEIWRAAKRPRAMLDLRSLDPARQTADRRVALAIGYGALGSMTFAAVAAGGGGQALVIGVVLALAGLPWVFAYNGRWRLLDDAIAGVPFAWRGDRAGVWSTAPIGGALLALFFVGDARAPGRRWRCWPASPARPATPPRCSTSSRATSG